MDRRLGANRRHQRAAFAREIPPVAAPARPLASDTPISNPSTRFAGLLVRQSTRRAEEMIVSHGVQGLFRVPVADVSFSGKTLTIIRVRQQLVRFIPTPRSTSTSTACSPKTRPSP